MSLSVAKSSTAIIDHLIIHIDGSGNKKRQFSAAEARVKVDGSAYVDGSLEVIVDSEPQPCAQRTSLTLNHLTPLI